MQLSRQSIFHVCMGLGFDLLHYMNQAQCYMPAIPALEWQRQDDQKFKVKASLGYTRPCPKMK